MNKYKIALTQALSDDGMAYLKQFAEVNVVNSSNAHVLLQALSGMDALISRGGTLDRQFFKEASKLGLKVVGKTSAGVDTVDLDAAAGFGIPVVFCPGANARSVAEYTVASILAANKQMMWSNQEMHRLHREYRSDYLGTNFEHKTVLLLGFGNIGKQVAAMCTALSMKVVVYDKYVPRQVIDQLGYIYTDDFHSVLGGTDFVSCHMPLTDETYGMLGEKELAMLKVGACVINTSRGGIVCEQALVENLNNGHLSSAVMDVIEGEPDIANSPLIGCDRVLLSGHIAGQTKESLFATAHDCTDGVIAVLNGEKWAKTANPKVYESEKWGGT